MRARSALEYAMVAPKPKSTSNEGSAQHTVIRLLLLCLFLICEQVSGQIMLRINRSEPLQITAKDLAELPRHTAVLNDHGKQISYEGVLVHDVLARGGVDFGKGLRGKQLSTYVTVIGADGYEVVYALAEFDPTISNSGIIVAEKREGRPLAANEGPLRIVAPNDQRPARSVRLLKEIDVIQLKN
ncbi:MAG TPA: molybdopterin-dependent oxidoreductase [Bryobacteraceae bacterium]|jgi:hypothetical protein